jgi:SAM-dependent methyltransferase
VRLDSGQGGRPGYDPHYFAALPQVEDRHFWFRARREVILETIRRAVPDWRERPLFDIGCGTGSLIAFLAEHGVPIAGACDAYVQALEMARRRVRAPLLLVDEAAPPPLGPGQRLLGLFDVLEHLDDDTGALAFLHSALEPGGFLVLTVPAHPFLFDEMDRMACHRRRYRRRDLGRKLRGAGFEVVRLTHFMAPLVPPLVAVRAARGLLRVGRRASDGWSLNAELRVVPGVNGVLWRVLALERRLLRAVSMPFGTSLIAVGRRARP